MTHDKTYKYEIFILLCTGLRPRDIVKLGFSRPTVYRWSAIYNRARKRLQTHIRHRIHVSLKRGKKAINLDDLTHE